MKDLLKGVRFRSIEGEKLLTAIAQDCSTKDVLMVAFMNREALELTIKTGKMHYYSTSRKRIWLKGEESGHFQKVVENRIDCDGDALLFLVEQKGAACHEGYRSCFFRRLDSDEWSVDREKLFNPDDVYKS